MRLLKYLLFFLLLIFALAIYAPYKLTGEIEYYEGVVERQDNIIRQHKKRIIELIQKMKEMENENSRLSNRKPKYTILESFDGMIIVVGPNIVKSNYVEMRETFDFIEKSYWETNISHLRGPYGLKQREENHHDGNIKGGA
jgi:hypothetical protein